MIRRILIANRGEIVRRIIKTCRQMGIETVAVFSEADANAIYLKEADQALPIGPANPMKSYLNMDVIIEAAQKSGSDAVHPGYGFLSENARFAKAVSGAGLTWIGPAPGILETIHSKSDCRKLAAEARVPVIPGSLGKVNDAEAIKQFGLRYGYPLFIKLDQGGGGKGIEIVQGEEKVDEVFKRANSIGQMAFGSPDCYVEKVVEEPRHIEVQFVADHHGNVVCLGERECSIQRRHQKIIEEAPSPVVTDKDRESLYEWTCRLAKAMNYHGAGTIEGLRSADGKYYFMEINARLQVEHPVSEMVTGIDIVQGQIDIASGHPLVYKQEDIHITGSAIEARIYAEDPQTFMPSPGMIEKVVMPPESKHLRIDHAMADGSSVPPYYDPMLAKVIAWGDDRAQSIGYLADALEALRVEGIKTTIPACQNILAHEKFKSGVFTTAFIERHL